MSLPFYELKCTHCDLIAQFSYRTSYRFDGHTDDPVRPKLRPGWCHDCDTATTVGSPLTDEDIHWEVEAYRELSARSIFSVFRTRARKKFIADQKAKIDRLVAAVEYYAKNPFPPRCLSCGGTHVASVDLPNDFGIPHMTGVNHACGGSIQATMRGRFSFGDRPEVWYDTVARTSSTPSSRRR